MILFLFWFAGIHDYKQLFIHTPVEHVSLCLGCNLLAFTVFTSYNQIFIQAEMVDVKAILILYFTW